MATAIDLRVWRNLKYFDPEPVLIELAKIGAHEWIQALPYEIASLRTRELKPFHERRLGALFFYLIGRALGVHVTFAHIENGDYDFVAHFEMDSTHHFVPVQMKELAPDFLNPTATLQGVIDAVRAKYTDSADLTLAIDLNRVTNVVPGDLDLSGLNLAGLWLFGTPVPDQSRWILIGDLLKPNAKAVEFDYPLPPAL